jgi:hypothetical protein
MSRALFSILILILFLTNVPICSAEVPELFREPSFNAATLAIAVNRFVAIGEYDTVKELAALCTGRQFVETNHGWLNVYQRIGWVCRVLYVPKGHEPLRPPPDGIYVKLPNASIPLQTWPLFPVVLSGKTYFVLSEL